MLLAEEVYSRYFQVCVKHGPGGYFRAFLYHRNVHNRSKVLAIFS